MMSSDFDTERNDPEYLGDGVYASHDGYQVWLHVGDHRNRAVVALESDVIEALVRYQKAHLKP